MITRKIVVQEKSINIFFKVMPQIKKQNKRNQKYLFTAAFLFKTFIQKPLSRMKQHLNNRMINFTNENLFNFRLI